MHGDEIYATASNIDVDSKSAISIVGSILLYCYVILFIFAIASLFIAVITDSYEKIKVVQQ